MSRTNAYRYREKGCAQSKVCGHHLFPEAWSRAPRLLELQLCDNCSKRTLSPHRGGGASAIIARAEAVDSLFVHPSDDGTEHIRIVVAPDAASRRLHDMPAGIE